MAKLNEEKILSYVDSLTVLGQVEFLDRIKEKVIQNLEKSKEEAEDKARDFESKINRISGNSY